MTKPAPPNTRAVPEFVTTAHPGDGQAERYALGALRRAADNIAFAPQGTRNDTLNRESWSIGQLVKAGHLDYELARDTINQAAIDCGLDQGEIDRTVPRAIQDAEARQVQLNPAYDTHDSTGLGFTPQRPQEDATGEPDAAAAAGEGEGTPQDSGEGDGVDAGDIPDREEQARQAREIRLQQEISNEARRMFIAEEAKKQLRRAETQELIGQLAPPTLLSDFLAIEDPPVQWVLEGLQPVGTRALLAAQAKSGKTTMVSNLIKALADRQQFLGDFFNHFDGTITLIDDELDDRMLRRWLKNLNIEHRDRVRVVTLRGRLGDFNIVDDQVRHVWADLLAGTDYLILDCLRPVLDACGLDENHEAGIFLNAFDALLKDAEIDNALVVHHMGHSNNRSRGDSRIMDWPDALWKLTREDTENPASKRHFSAFGREVDVKQQPLHYTNGVLVLNDHDGTVREKYASTPEEWVVQTMFLDSRGQAQKRSWLEDEKRTEDRGAGAKYVPSRDSIRQAIASLTERGLLLTESGEGRGAPTVYRLNADNPEVAKMTVSG